MNKVSIVFILFELFIILMWAIAGYLDGNNIIYGFRLGCVCAIGILILFIIISFIYKQWIGEIK